MLQEVFAVLAILGMVVGSGFISGKEVVVFFSRFGAWSFLSIPLVFVIFLCAFRFILNKAGGILEMVQKSKVLTLINLLLCTIFSAAMFGGINNLLSFGEKWINFAVFFLILLICALIFKKGGKFFNKLNIMLVPIMIFVFVVLLFSKIEMPKSFSSSHGVVSIFYACLYCLLNLANGCVVLAEVGKNLNKKQKARVAFISALVLCVVLLLTNIVLLAHPAALDEEMPVLSIFSSGGSAVVALVVFIGCLTTLFSIVYSCSSLVRGMIKNEHLNFTISIILPLVLSVWGFSNIVQHLYPLASVMGGVLLVRLFFVFPLKRSDKQIHASCKNAKKKNACHHDVEF
ncbi:MAG: hypothetical protein IJY90_00740 [Clostridia bacterium]|nr:hypothetical protein [Clostridia bacterium]